MAASHYETLGVPDGADPEEVRRAYLDLARQLHPDRWSGAGAGERAEADRRMREVNEAWRVLGNPGRRLAYDVGRGRTRSGSGSGQAGAATSAAPGGSFSSGDLFVDDGPPPDLVTRFIRFLPWAAVLVALAGIFVFTAYATSDDREATTCVRLDGGTVNAVGCDEPGARAVVVRVPDVNQCPAGSQPFQPAGEDQALCLDR